MGQPNQPYVQQRTDKQTGFPTPSFIEVERSRKEMNSPSSELRAAGTQQKTPGHVFRKPRPYNPR